MSHEVETMAYSGEKPWHGLGVNVTPDISTDEMLIAAGLNWTADLVPLFYRLGDREASVRQKALVRSSDSALLDVVGEDWKPVQNADALGFFSDFVQQGDMRMETAGSLKSGRHVFALAKITEKFQAVKGDEIGGYLLFSNPHQYGKAPCIMLTMVRVVCNNTLTLALREGGTVKYSWSHLKTFDTDHAAMAREALGIAKEQMTRAKEQMTLLAKAKITEEDTEVYFKRVFDPKGAQSSRDKIARNVPLAMKALEEQPGAKYGAGTYWQAFNAVTFLTDHVLGKSQDTRVNSALFGGYAALKRRALDIAIQSAKTKV